MAAAHEIRLHRVEPMVFAYPTNCPPSKSQTLRVDYLPAPVGKLGLIAKGNEVTAPASYDALRCTTNLKRVNGC